MIYILCWNSWEGDEEEGICEGWREGRRGCCMRGDRLDSCILYLDLGTVDITRCNYCVENSLGPSDGGFEAVVGIIHHRLI